MHWFIIVNQKEARIFTRTPDKKRLRLLRAIVSPLGDEKKAALIRKKAGRGIKTIGRSATIYYSQPKRSDPREDAMTQFARRLARLLKSENQKKHFDTLTVVAEPHFLGKLRAEMNRALKETVTAWIKKDLLKTPPHRLIRLLSPGKKLPEAS